MEASLLLTGGGPHNEILALLDEADRVWQPKNRVLRALLMQAENGIERALEYLDDPIGADERTARGHLLVFLDRPQEALAVLDFSGTNLEADVDTRRWRTFAHLSLGEVAQARLEVEKALARGRGPPIAPAHPA